MTAVGPGSRELVAARFWAKVDRSPRPRSCWLWTGSLTGKGYGKFWLNGRDRQAAQVAWELEHGMPFPKGRLACHRCDNEACVRPAHIYAGTESDNMHDAEARGRFRERRPDVCARGHDLTGDNAYHRPGNGRRACRTCQAERKARRSGAA